MESQRFILVNQTVRNNALRAVSLAPDNHTVTVAPRKRTNDQNAKFHAICGDIEASRYEHFGKARDADEWKVLLVSAHTKATKGEVDIVPGLEGEMVNIRESTARMSVARASSLIEYALAWCAEHNIELTETRRLGYLDERAVA